MRLSAIAALMIVTTVLLACAQQNMAAIEDKSGAYFGRNPQPMQAYVPQQTFQAATVDSIERRDLAARMQVTTTSSQPTYFQPPAAEQRRSTWQWPVTGKVISGFGKQSEGIENKGISIAASRGTPIRAAADGEVAYVGSNIRDYGNMVILRHAGSEMSAYSHASDIIVAKGMTVKQGDTIGYVGTSGNARIPQLHFAIRAGDEAIDPMSKLPSQYAAAN